MTHNQLTRIATTALTLVVVLSMVTMPVAATDGDDGGLLGDDGDDDGGLVSNTTDSVTDTVDSTTDAVSDATGTDAVSDTTDSVTDTVDSTSDTVDSTTDSVTDASGADSVSEPTDALDTETLPGTERLGDVTNPDEIAFGDLSSADDLVDPAGSVPSVGEGSAAPSTLERTASTDQLPVGLEDLPVESVPVTGEDAPVQPEDSPYGSEGHGNFDACALPVDEENLPLDSVPSPGDAGVAVPGVPLDLLTPRAVAGLAFGTAPKPCTVYDPHDPSVDPTEVPEDASATLSTDHVNAATDRAMYEGGSSGQLYEASQYATWVVGASNESVGTFQEVGIDNGETDKYVYVYNFRSANYRDRTTVGTTRVAVLNKEVGVALACSNADLANASVNPEQPTKGGPCSYELEGLPSLPVGPGTVFDAIEEPPEPPELPGIGGLPANSDSLVDL